MIRQQLAALGDKFVVDVANESLFVFGNAAEGYSVLLSEGGGRSSYRYTSLDELVFALINLSVACDGEA